jgi:hypothetical protein
LEGKNKKKRINKNGIKDVRYKQLKKRCSIGIDVPISEFDEEVEKQINSVCDRNVGWVIDQASKSKQSLRLRRYPRKEEDVTE